MSRSQDRYSQRRAAARRFPQQFRAHEQFIASHRRRARRAPPVRVYRSGFIPAAAEQLADWAASDFSDNYVWYRYNTDGTVQDVEFPPFRPQFPEDADLLDELDSLQDQSPPDSVSSISSASPDFPPLTQFVPESHPPDEPPPIGAADNPIVVSSGSSFSSSVPHFPSLSSVQLSSLSSHTPQSSSHFTPIISRSIFENVQSSSSPSSRR